MYCIYYNTNHIVCQLGIHNYLMFIISYNIEKLESDISKQRETYTKTNYQHNTVT